MTSKKMISSTIPNLITAVAGLIIIVQYVFDIKIVADIGKEILSWVIIIAAFSMGQGLVNLGRSHTKKITVRIKDWIFSIIFLISMAAMIIAGIPTIIGKESTMFDFIYLTIQKPMDITVKSLLGFFILSAAYRAFKVRNVESGLMLFSVIAVMLFMVPIGSFVKPIPAIGEWIRDILNTATFRAFRIGILLGIVAVGLRTLLGKGGGLSRMISADQTEGDE